MHDVKVLNVDRQTVHGKLLLQFEKVDNEHTHRFTGIVIHISFYKYKQRVKMWNSQIRRDDWTFCVGNCIGVRNMRSQIYFWISNAGIQHKLIKNWLCFILFYPLLFVLRISSFFTFFAPNQSEYWLDQDIIEALLPFSRLLPTEPVHLCVHTFQIRVCVTEMMDGETLKWNNKL